MAWQIWHGIWYDLAGMALFMVWPGGHEMIFGMAREGMAWYIAWPVWHDMVYGMAWRVMTFYGMTWRSMTWYLV